MPDHMTQPLSELAEAIIADGIVDADEVKKISERIYADGIIDRDEADFLFTINDAVSDHDNDPSWQKLFVDALTAHVLEDETSPDVLDDDEAQYLISKIQGDDKVDTTEQALMVNIISKAKSAPETFNEFALSALKDSILEDGIIDAQEVETIRKVIYGSGGSGGEGVSRLEADFLFDLNDATTGKANHESWKELFVEAITSHLLEDEVSPGEVDADEGDWLVSRIEGDGQYDDNELALLTNLKSKAKSIDGKLKFKIDLVKA
jgi:uncharacterized membrane protein YebE (DUF533 family)